jgi:hypothetical protein
MIANQLFSIIYNILGARANCRADILNAIEYNYARHHVPRHNSADGVPTVCNI